MLSIQDMGRSGLAYFAIPSGGVMDRRAAALANAILGQEESLPLLEVSMMAPTIEFLSSAVICMTGADFGWMLNGKVIKLTQALVVAPGDVLSGDRAMHGFRGYIGIQGQLVGQRHWGSISTYPLAKLGGLDGQYLSTGSTINWDPIVPKRARKSLGQTEIKQTFVLHPGPEMDRMDKGSRSRLFERGFRISAASNRMGIRLEGEVLHCQPTQLSKSVAVVPGMIQLPPSGQAIIILRDGQTTGGYPRIGYIPQAEHDALGQVSIGSEVRFIHP